MKDIIKKYWFIGLIIVALVAGVAYYAIDSTKDIVQGKTVDGENVVYSLSDNDVTAGQFYDSLYEDMGASAIAQLFQFALVDQLVETTDEMLVEAEAQAEYTIDQFKSSYGATYEDTLLAALKSMGYDSIDDLSTHMVLQLKYNVILEEAATDLFDEFNETYSPRILSHILVAMADSENPTDEELAKWEEVKTALEDGTSFAEVAYTYSDDTGSATSGGYLGYSDTTTSYVTEFLEAGLALEAGEYSEWVKTDYGYHLIYCEATDFDTLLVTDGFLDAVFTAYPTYISELLFIKADELETVYESDELEAQLKALFGVGGDE